MFRLSSGNQLVVTVAAALAFLPLLGFAVSGFLRQHGRTAVRLSLVVVLASVASAFVLRPRFGETSIEGPGELLRLARVAQLTGGGIVQLDSVVSATRRRPGRAALAELIALANAGASAPIRELPDTLFSGGAKLQSARTAQAQFEGWLSYDRGDGGCEVVVLFRPLAPIHGRQVWVHAYPPNSRDYVDVNPALPPAPWAAGQLGWEVFRPADRVTLYAGTERDGDLGPAVPLGAIQACGR